MTVGATSLSEWDIHVSDTGDVNSPNSVENLNIAIYAIGSGIKETGFIRLAVTRLAKTYDRVEVFLHWQDAERYTALLGDIAPLYIRCAATELGGVMPLYRAAMTDLFARPGQPRSVLLTGAHVFGPVVGAAAPKLSLNADVSAPYWHGCHADPRLDRTGFPDRIPVFDHTLIGANVLRDRDFQSLWRDVMLTGDVWHDHVHGALRLGHWLVASDFEISYAVSQDALGSAEPWLYEAGTALHNKSPCLSVQALHLDPVVHDLNASTLRDAFDYLRDTDKDLYNSAMGICLAAPEITGFLHHSRPVRGSA